MEITVNDLTSVDKELIITADREDLQPQFNKAYKKYKQQINMPGFRPGRVPMGLVKKRFGKEIEAEEVRNYVLDLYENKIAEEYNPVGESQFEEIKWEDDKLEVKIKIGQKPEFELADLSDIEVEKMVHDVTDEEVEEELENILEREADWKDTKAKISKEHKVVIDLYLLDEDGNRKEDNVEEGMEIELSSEDQKIFLDLLKDHKVGETVEGELEDEKVSIDIKEVKKKDSIELDDELAKDLSNGQAEDVESYKAFLKSQIQDYYDRTAENTAKNGLMESMVAAHDFEVPQTVVDQVIKQRVEEIKKKYNIEADLDIDSYRDSFQDQSEKDTKWHFITDKLTERYEDEVELNESDVDAYLAQQAAQMGVDLEMIKNVYASNPNELESLRRQIREEKVYEKALDEVKISEISKEEYQKKQEEAQEAAKKAQAEKMAEASEDKAADEPAEDDEKDA